jgi:hypothetical protein
MRSSDVNTVIFVTVFCFSSQQKMSCDNILQRHRACCFGLTQHPGLLFMPHHSLHALVVTNTPYSYVPALQQRLLPWTDKTLEWNVRACRVHVNNPLVKRTSSDAAPFKTKAPNALHNKSPEQS